MLGKKEDVILNRKKNVSTRGKDLKVSVPNKGKQKKSKIDQSGKPKKVYCKNCVDLVMSRTGGYACHTNANKLITQSEQEWLTPDTGFALIEHPSSKNQKNHCPDFIRKIG